MGLQSPTLIKNKLSMNIKTNNSYTAPMIEVVETVVEKGFEASFGDTGYAGDDFDNIDNGSF